MTLEATWKLENETVEIWRFGVNDYAANFINGDWSVRGTLEQVMSEVLSAETYLDF